MKIGCHAVLFTDAISTDTKNVLSSLHAAGAQGAEIGSRFFDLNNVDRLLHALDDSGMQISGLHVIASLMSLLDNPEAVRLQMENAAKFLQHIPCKNIIATGGIDPAAMNLGNLGDDRLTKPENARIIASNLNDIAIYLKSEYGVQIHYHNHNWEFKNNAVIFNALIKYAPQIFFALDIGWAAVSGFDPITLIETTCKGRVHYVHLRDYKKESLVKCTTFEELHSSFVDLGEGDMPYQTLMNTLAANLDSKDWVVVEYEKGEVDVKRYESACTYVKQFML